MKMQIAEFKPRALSFVWIVLLVCDISWSGFVEGYAPVGKLFILSIGVNRNPPLSPLRTCETDAVSFADSLGSVAASVYKEVTKLTLVGKTASFDAVRDAFHQIIDRSRPEDTFVFFFAGHSTIDTVGDLHLLTRYVTVLDKPDYRGISGIALKTWSSQIQARNQLFVLDAGRTSFDKFRESLEMVKERIRNLTETNIVMLAVSPWGAEFEKHGFLSMCLIEGLSKDVRSVYDREEKRIVSAWGLETCTSRIVYEYTAEHFPLKFRIQQYVRGNDFILGCRIAAEDSAALKSERGARIVAPSKQNDGNEPLRERTDYALIFAANTYEQWSSLTNPINDARTIQEELKDGYGFKTELVENAIQDSILSKLSEYREKKYTEKDQLVVFFAGHGDYDESMKEGYVVAKDSRAIRDDKFRKSLISHSQLRSMVDNLPCKHILVALDVCFGGTFDQRIASSSHRGDEYEDVTDEKFMERNMKLTTRRYIASGGKNYVPDGRPGQHSPFARKFIEALRSYGGKNRILTIPMIEERVQRVDPEPYAGEFGSNEPGSGFFLRVR